MDEGLKKKIDGYLEHKKEVAAVIEQVQGDLTKHEAILLPELRASIPIVWTIVENMIGYKSMCFFSTREKAEAVLAEASAKSNRPHILDNGHIMKYKVIVAESTVLTRVEHFSDIDKNHHFWYDSM